MKDSERLAQIRERVEKAAPGRWAAWNAYGCAGGTHPADAECVHVARLGPAIVDTRMGIVADGGRGDLNGHRDDFQFLAHAREDVAWLLDYVKGLSEAMEGDWQIIHGYRCLPAPECDGFKDSCMWPRRSAAPTPTGEARG